MGVYGDEEGAKKLAGILSQVHLICTKKVRDENSSISEQLRNTYPNWVFITQLALAGLFPVCYLTCTQIIRATAGADMANSGAVALAAWMERSKLTRAQLAHILGISRPYMTQLLGGLRTPSLPLGKKIYDLSGVPIRAWLDNSVSDLERRAG